MFSRTLTLAAAIVAVSSFAYAQTSSNPAMQPNPGGARFRRPRRPGPSSAHRSASPGNPNLVFDRTIPAADHNDIYQDPAFAPAMREALQSLLADRR